MISLDFRKK